MGANRFEGLTNGGRPRTADRSVRDQLMASHTGQVSDIFHHPTPKETRPATNQYPTPQQIRAALSAGRERYVQPSSPLLPPHLGKNHEPIGKLREGGRKRKRHNGRRTQEGPFRRG